MGPIADDTSWTSEVLNSEEDQAQTNDSVATENPNICFDKNDVYVPSEFYFEARKLRTTKVVKHRAERIANREGNVQERSMIK